MTVTVRAITTPALDSSSPYNVAKPTGTLEGDLLIASVLGTSAAIEQILPPDGWYAVRGGAVNGDNNVSAWYKVAGASEPSSYDFTSLTNTSVGVGIISLTGSGALNIEAVATQVNASGNRVYPSVTFSAAGMLVCMGAMGAGSTGASTPPGGATEQWDVTISGNRTYCMTESIAAAGATGTRTATGTTTSSKCISIAVVEAVTTYPGVRYRSHASAGPSSGSSIAVTMPATIVAGDMLIAHMSLLADRTVTTPSGWTLQANLATTGALRVFSKVAESGDAGATLTVSFSGGSTTASLAVTAFWSPDAYTLQVGQVATSSASAVATIDFPTVTSTADGSALVMLTSKAATVGYQATSNLDLWERYDYGASSIRTSLFTEYLTAVGATGTRAVASSSGTTSADMVSLLIEAVREGILFDGVDLRDYLTSWKLESTVRVAPTTVLSSQAGEQIPILSDWMFTCAGMWAVAVDNVFGAACASSQNADSALFVEMNQAIAYESDTAYVARYKAPLATIDGALVWEATIAISGAPTRSVL